MVVDDLFSVIHAAVTDLDCITIKDFPKFVVFREVSLSTRARNLCPILVLTFLLNGSCTRVCCSIVCFFILLVVGGS